MVKRLNISITIEMVDNIPQSVQIRSPYEHTHLPQKDQHDKKAVGALSETGKLASFAPSTKVWYLPPEE